MTNFECETMTGLHLQEEAGTFMIHNTVEVASNGMNVYIYSHYYYIPLYMAYMVPIKSIFINVHKPLIISYI